MAADPDEWVMPRSEFSRRSGLSASIHVARRSIVCSLERPDALLVRAVIPGNAKDHEVNHPRDCL
jgi:hypothetical protein